MRRRNVLLASAGATALCTLVLMLGPALRAFGGFKVESKPADPPATQPLGQLSEADKKLPQDNNYVVHEWGTFTSFSGSDGVSLDFRPLVDEDLPHFVMDRPRQAALNDRRELAYSAGKTVKGTVLSKQRMETPVTYFYSDQERIVDVSVEFPKGLLTEFYPPARQFGPSYKKDAPEPLTSSWLRWGKIRLLPNSRALNEQGVDPYIQKIDDGENPHYGYARETDSVHLQITDPATLAVYREKFLFYRGVGNFDLPVRLDAQGSGRFNLTYSGKTPLHYAFLVEIDGDKVRYARYNRVSGTIPMALPSQPASLDALADDMVRALVSDGLFEKEAQAMVKTWKSSWFGERGTRVLYGLPQGQTNDLLPLNLSPAPRELVRVMIGRLEIMTPEQEARLNAFVSQLGDANPTVRQRASDGIHEMGRFAEPALTRVVATTTDPEALSRAQGLLAGIRQQKGLLPARLDQKK